MHIMKNSCSQPYSSFEVKLYCYLTMSNRKWCIYICRTCHLCYKILKHTHTRSSRAEACPFRTMRVPLSHNSIISHMTLDKEWAIHEVLRSPIWSALCSISIAYVSRGNAPTFLCRIVYYWWMVSLTWGGHVGLLESFALLKGKVKKLSTSNLMQMSDNYLLRWKTNGSMICMESGRK